MRTQFWAAVLLGAAVPAVLAQNITIYGPDDLSTNVSATFLDCLNSLSTSYRVYVDEGVTVVLPASINQTIDLEDTDVDLYNCMTILEVITAMQIATEDTIEDDETQSSAVNVSTATHSWLVGRGAQGQKPIGTQLAGTNITLDTRDSETDDALMMERSPDSDGSGLAKRTIHYHYFGYLSDYKDCSSSDLVIRYGGTCYNHSQRGPACVLRIPSLTRSLL